jgi:hypothetical protein
MLDEVAIVETVEPAPQPERSPDAKAIRYLIQSGAAAVYVTGVDDFVAIRSAGTKIDPRTAAAIYWVRKQDAIPLTRRARKAAGDNPNTEEAISALREAAAAARVKLTEHSIAISRAGASAQRLDAYLLSMRGTGALKEFNRAFKRRRLEATANGRGFMTFKTAMTRLQTLLIPILQQGRNVQTTSLFASIFGDK